MKRGLLIALVLIALFIFLNSDVLGNSVTGDAFKPRFRNLFSRAPSPPVQLPPTANQNPKGWFDKADCSFLSGWTCDPNNYASALGIYFYEGNAVVGKVVANKQRESAVAQQCGGNANHGFFIGTPTSLKDNKQHTIIAKAIDTNTGAQIPLSGNPKTLTCLPSSMICGGACNNGVCPAEFRGGCSNGVCVDPVCTEDDQSVSYKGPGCSNGADDDADGKIDCQDSGCSTATNCQQLESVSAGNCADNLDNDKDGFTDCADTGCAGASNCQSVSQYCGYSCSFFLYTAFQGSCPSPLSCVNSFCSASGCVESQASGNCVDLVDNDQDGFTDCADKDCIGGTSCAIEVPQLCKDSIDNDKDGFTDCSDPDCFNTCEEGSYSTCFNGADDDLDGAVDRNDIDCKFFATESNAGGCADRKDNDGNGFTDCADVAACSNSPYCAERGTTTQTTQSGTNITNITTSTPGCFNGADDDADGTQDCQDQDCIIAGVCGPTETGRCGDYIDNDGDNLMDCDDWQDCSTDQMCACADSDGGMNHGQFGSTTIAGVKIYERYDYCDYYKTPATQQTTSLREQSCSGTQYRGIYGIGPQLAPIDCTTLGKGYTKCVNGACV